LARSDERRDSHSRHANSFSAQILGRFDVAIDGRLDPETASMDPSSKLHGQPLAGRFASNGTFWSMLYGLSGKRPEWFAEVAARWLDRLIDRS
jgi:hypothetical protein